MKHEVRSTSRFAQKLYDVLLPETKRAVAAVDDWAVLGTLAGPIRPQNQDRMVAGRFRSSDASTFRLVALSDGMGGLSFGQEAAALTLSCFLWCMTSRNGPITERIGKAAHFANRMVHAEFGGNSGATLSAVVMGDDGSRAAVNVGDSRLYGYNSQSRELEQLSVDDTLAGLANQGVSIDVRHNAGALLQYIGMGDELEPNVIMTPDLFVQDLLILSTDGIHWIGNKLLELIAQNASDHGQLARRLMQLAEMAGAHDNATIGIIATKVPTHRMRGATYGLDVELWTPDGKTIILLDRPEPPTTASTAASNTPPNNDAQAPASPTSAKEGEKKPQKKRKSRGGKRNAKRVNQPDLLEPPELSLEFGSPKRQEDETSG